MAYSDEELIAMTARQLSSGLVRAICLARNISLAERREWRIHETKLHSHDDSQGQISWNNVQAILFYNEHTGENIPVPLTATEGYNQHGHTGPYDGGYIPGMGPHDHRDNFNGGFAFAVYHPGTSLPQMPWVV
jgi:hypothetical protein